VNPIHLTNPNKLTEKQSRLLNRLLDHRTPQQIAVEDSISVATVYDMLRHLRHKYKAARQFINEFDSKYRSKLRKYLW
jgi:DNA-binding CsgD family transcriptional regulator